MATRRKINVNTYQQEKQRQDDRESEFGQHDRGPPPTRPDIRYDDHAAKLEYMRQLLMEFRKLADGLGEHTLVYLLEMAVLEIDESTRVHEFRASLDG